MPSAPRRRHVLISHADEDRAVAERLCRKRETNLDTVLAMSDAGRDLAPPRKLEEALEECDGIVVLLTILGLRSHPHRVETQGKERHDRDP